MLNFASLLIASPVRVGVFCALSIKSHQREI